MEENTIRVLLIEDSEDLAQLVRRTLPPAAKVPVEVSWVPRLDAGIDRARNSHFDAILLDLSLPDSSGLDSVMRIRQHCPDIPIVVLTAEEDEQTALRAVAAGAQDYITKTEWRPDTLARAIRYAVERHKKAFAVSTAKAFRAVVLIGARGGVGTTSVSLNIAAAVARSGRQTLAIELNPWRGGFAVPLGLRPSHPLSELTALPPAAITRNALSPLLLDVAPRFQVVCSARRSSDSFPIGAEQTEAIVTAAMQMAEFVILDLPPFLTQATRAVLATAFFTMLVTERDAHCLAMAKDTASVLEEWASGANCLGAIVVNRSPGSEAIPVQQVRSVLGCRVFGVVPPAPGGIAYSDNLPLTLSKPDLTFSQSLADIALRLTDFPVRFAD